MSSGTKAKVATLSQLLVSHPLGSTLAYICLLKDGDLWRLESGRQQDVNEVPRQYLTRLMDFASLVESSPAVSQELRCQWLSLALAYDHILQGDFRARIIEAFRHGHALSLRTRPGRQDGAQAGREPGWNRLELDSLAEAEIGLFTALRVTDCCDRQERQGLISEAESALLEAQSHLPALSPFVCCYVRWAALLSSPYISDAPAVAFDTECPFFWELKQLLEDLVSLGIETEDALIMRRDLEVSVTDVRMETLLGKPETCTLPEVMDWQESIRETLVVCGSALNLVSGPEPGEVLALEKCAGEVYLRIALAQSLVFTGDWAHATKELSEIEAFVQKYLAADDEAEPLWPKEDADLDAEGFLAECLKVKELPGEDETAEQENESQWDEDLVYVSFLSVQTIVEALRTGESLSAINALEAAALGAMPDRDKADLPEEAADMESWRCALGILNVAGWGARARSDKAALARLAPVAAYFAERFQSLFPEVCWAWDR